MAVLFLPLSVAVGDASAADYHIASGGDDSAAGTSPETAWRTLARTDRHSFVPGDRLLLRGGDGFEGNLVLGADDAGTPERPVTVGSYGRGRAVIRAGEGTAVLAENAGGIVIRDLVLVGKARTANKGSGVKVINTLPGGKRLKSVRIENVEASGFGREGIFVGGAPADRSRSGFEDVVISGCTARDNALCGIYVTGAGDPKAETYANKSVAIRGCTAADNTGDPDYLKNHSGSGILLDDCDGGRIEECLAYGNGSLCNCTIGGPVGIWAHAADKVVIERCASFSNRTGKGLDGGGFDFDGGVTNSVMQYNYSADNDGPGFMLYNYADSPHRFAGNTVRFNVSVNDARKNRYGAVYVGNHGSGVRDQDVYHNTVFVSPSDRGGRPRAVVTENVSEVRFRNNLLVTAGDVPLLETKGGQDKVAFQGNGWWASGGKFAIRDGKDFASLAAWREAKGQERLEGRDVGFSADPKMADPGKVEIPKTAADIARLAAHRPQPGSPALGAGLDLKRLFGLDAGPRDFAGGPLRAGTWDVGAVGGEGPSPR
jgi:hypothetical protein